MNVHPEPPFEHTYAGLPAHFHAQVAPTAVSAPSLIRLNDALAKDLGLDTDALRSRAGIAMLAGNRVPDSARPLAMAYAGHQFGHFVPQLGDGRAILLGELVDSDGVRRDVQLKGAGRTPFSRSGDGRTALRPAVREYLASEAMAALGIPTQRALALLTTGDTVYRERPEPGGLLVRVARSHVRVGTFEYFFYRNDQQAVHTLADYVIDRHYPHLHDSDRPYRDLLDAVIGRTAGLVAAWMHVGFIHGVMNTDNVAISGETIDYGPFGFIDTYDPATVYSAIDVGGRYAFDQQPGIAHWNLTRFAQTLVPLLDSDGDRAVEIAQHSLEAFGPQINAEWQAGLVRKLGLTGQQEGDAELALDLLTGMADQQADFTRVFRCLSALPDDPASDGGRADAVVRVLFNEPAAFDAWAKRWRQRLAKEQRPQAERIAAMRATNPAYILRNHLAQRAVDAAADGNFSVMEELMTVLASPFEDHPGYEHYARPPQPEEKVTRTFCGT